MMDRKPNDRFDLRELFDTLIESLKRSSNPIKDVIETITSPVLDTREPYRSRRIVRAPNRFMFLEEVVSDEHDLDP